MTTRYFVLFLAYDGKGAAALANEVIQREHPIHEYADVARIEDDLKALSKAHHVVLLHFIPVGQEKPAPAQHAEPSLAKKLLG